jgi:hypothetical protein
MKTKTQNDVRSKALEALHKIEQSSFRIYADHFNECFKLIRTALSEPEPPYTVQDDGSFDVCPHSVIELDFYTTSYDFNEWMTKHNLYSKAVSESGFSDTELWFDSLNTIEQHIVFHQFLKASKEH